MTRYLLLLCMAGISCSLKIERPVIKGYVYNKATKQPLAGAGILSPNKEGYYKEETVTDNKGMFMLEQHANREFLAMESGHDPKFYEFVVTHAGYAADTIEEHTRGSFGKGIKVYDSIFLAPATR